ncbi:MAG: ATP-binding protein [Floccifex sp.]
MINIYAELKDFKDRYLKSIIAELYSEHPELQEEIERLIQETKNRKENDNVSGLLDKSNIPDSNSILNTNGFDPEILSVEDKDMFYSTIQNLQFMSDREHPNLLFFGPPLKGKEQLAQLIGKEACKNGYNTQYVYYHNLLKTLRDHEFVKAENKEYEHLQKCDLLIIDDFACEKIQVAETAESLQWLLRQRTIDHMNCKGKKPRCTLLLCQYPRCEWNTQIVNEGLKADYVSALIENHGIEMVIDRSKKETFSQSWF